MTLHEAAVLLELPIDATREQIESRSQALTESIQAKISAAPAEFFKAKHRASLEQITAAVELLKLAQDVNSSDPSITRADINVTNAPFKIVKKSSNKGTSAPFLKYNKNTIPDPTPVPSRPVVSARKTGISQMAIIVMVVSILVVATTWGLWRASSQREAANNDIVLIHLETKTRWTRIEAEFVQAKQLNSQLAADLIGEQLLAKSSDAKARARAKAQAEFIHWADQWAAKHPVKKSLVRLNNLISLSDFRSAAPVAKDLKSALEQAEREFAARKASLLALSKPLVLDSKPSGLRYTIIDAYGQNLEGRTPAQFDAPWGLTKISVSSPGPDWAEYSKDFYIERETPNTLNLVFDYSEVKLASIPSGLRFEFIQPNGRVLRGVTPAELRRVPTGRSTFKVYRPDWPDMSKVVEVVASEVNDFTAEFADGGVKIMSEPEGATVMEGTKNLGSTPLVLRNLSIGEKQFAVKLKDYGAAIVTVKILANQIVSTEVVLKPSPPLTPGQPYTVPDLGLLLEPISAGRYTAGSMSTDPDHNSDETAHKVEITRPFWLGKYEVTRGEWLAVMKPALADTKDDQLPMTNVSWEEAQVFCRKLNERERSADRLPNNYEYSLPTEAQWEYACRADSNSAFGRTGGLREVSNLDELGWYRLNSSGRAHEVGLKKPNAWGLYDMHGNVWEWCLDWYELYPKASVIDPKGPPSGTGKITRGGSWGSEAASCRSATRLNSAITDRSENLGFRLALVSRTTTESAN
jgi:formylglycine-generating enzyme required for sulfatase activity